MSEKIYIYEVIWQTEPILQVKADNGSVSKEACYYPKLYEKTFLRCGLNRKNVST